MFQIPRRTEQWFKALMAAFIGGCSSSFLNAIGVTTVNTLHIASVQQFTLKQLAEMTVIGGIVSAAFYLKQSPVPPDSTGDTQIFAKGAGGKVVDMPPLATIEPVKTEPTTTDKGNIP